jgi:transcriptional regulator with XRE-family HTH domain
MYRIILRFSSGFLYNYSGMYKPDGREAMHIGERIQRLRAQRGWSQNELAKQAKLYQALISRLENQVQDTLHPEALKKLAKTLGVSADYLIGMYEDVDDRTVKPARRGRPKATQSELFPTRSALAYETA